MATRHPRRPLTLRDARRIALRAQGLGVDRPSQPNRGHLRKSLARLGSLQIDAVNVLVRAQYLPLFSRLGPYDTAMLDELTYRRGEGFEYLTHAASIADTALHPLLRWRMDERASGRYWTEARAAIDARRPGYVDRVMAEIAERGPLGYRDLVDPARRERPKTHYADSSLLWWSKRPSDGKHVLEAMWMTGVLAVRGRTPSFERIFDLTERVLPAAVVEAPTPAVTDARRGLVSHALGALGVAWVSDIADYHRLKVAHVKGSLAELVESGEAVPVEVEGVPGPAYLHVAARSTPARGAALLGPFDSLLWERSRNERLFGFRHSFEIYVPEPRRQFGYYVLPFLLGESLVARVDLKADRSAGKLLVRAAHLEPGFEAGEITGPLADELRLMAEWLGLERVAVGKQGTLAAALARARP